MSNFLQQMKQKYKEASLTKIVGLDSLRVSIAERAEEGEITLMKIKGQEWSFSEEALRVLDQEGFDVAVYDRYKQPKLSITLSGIETVRISWK